MIFLVAAKTIFSACFSNILFNKSNKTFMLMNIVDNFRFKEQNN